jgi:hypothetical protein
VDRGTVRPPKVLAQRGPAEYAEAKKFYDRDEKDRDEHVWMSH